ncbi:MAG: hypothetical protein IPG08_14925 [Sphingobacteriaceae bacterium]|nr:hypothetical protein [Sphingobacteriaceae bacterium]
MRIWFKNILLLTLLFLLTFSCKKESKNEPSPAPTNNAVPCNATNLMVDSIIEITGQSKIYKLTVINHTITQSNSTVSIIAGTSQVTMTVLGDTTINSLLGKRYRIQRTDDWDIKAYSYLNPSDSLWHLIPYDNNESLIFNVVIKLPIVPSSTYVVVSNSIHIQM